MVPEKMFTYTRTRNLQVCFIPGNAEETSYAGLTKYNLSHVPTERAKYPSAMKVVAVEMENAGIGVKMH